MKKLLFRLLWKEIREFTLWAMHSGHCRQSVRKEDYYYFLKNKDKRLSNLESSEWWVAGHTESPKTHWGRMNRNTNTGKQQ